MLRYGLTFILAFMVVGYGYSQKNVQLLGHLSYPDRTSDIWGYIDTGGTEYAIIGLLDGVSIVDVSTDVNNPNELFRFPGDSSIWRDIKTWDQHAYVVNEESGGLFIMDLSGLPGQIDTMSWHGDTLNFLTAHNLFIDENGIGYLYGSNVGVGGAIIFDLNTDPENPDMVGFYDLGYIHDGFVRNDTMWNAEIFKGWVSIVDVSDKANPVLLETVITPGSFTHNCWVSEDGRTLFSTDEIEDGFVASYDVSDLSNIEEADLYQSSPRTGSIPHNTYFINDYLVTSYYADGITIVDAQRSHNLVQTGNYDTSPFPSGPGFRGAWGVYPYLPSGNLIVSDVNEGLFVLRPEYSRACYLEGVVSRNDTLIPLTGASIEIIGHNTIKNSDILGQYATGIADSGFYDIRFSHPLCQTTIVQSVKLTNGNVVELDVTLNCHPVGINQEFEEEYLIWISGTNKLKYHLTDPTDKVCLVYDIAGRIVFEIALNTKENMINVPQWLSPGIYIATIPGLNSLTKAFAIN